jgi:hypothetical protein
VLLVRRLSGDACNSTRSPLLHSSSRLADEQPALDDASYTIPSIGTLDPVTSKQRSRDSVLLDRRLSIHEIPSSDCSLRRRIALPHDLPRLHEPSLRFNIASISTSQPPQHRRHLSVAVFSTLLKDIIAVSDVEFLNLTTSRSSRLRLPAVGRSTAEQLVGPAPQSHTLITLQRSPIMSCRELHASIIMATAQSHTPVDGNSSSLPTHQSYVFSLVLSHANGPVH